MKMLFLIHVFVVAILTSGISTGRKKKKKKLPHRQFILHFDQFNFGFYISDVCLGRHF